MSARNKSFTLSLSKGFTLIELLIVIAVLGILAVAVLSAINPIEQINRSRDTGSRSDSEQLINATDRYYAAKGYYPWADGEQSTNLAIDPMVEIDAADQTFGDDNEPMLTNLSIGGTQEVKESFVTRIVSGTANHLSIYNQGTQGDSTYVCFVPRSGSFRTDAWNRCTSQEGYGALPSDFPPTACPADGTCQTAAAAEDATGCYSCLP